MQHLYAFHPQLVLRTPALPLSALPEPSTAVEWQAELADEHFAEALYLASPALHAECQRWQRGELSDAKKIAKLLGTLGRYRSRMRSRCTPFGLFAGCSVVSWGAQTRLCLDAAATTRHTRLDMHYLCALAANLARLEALRYRLRYFPNSSIYAVGSELRYVEHCYGDSLPPEGEHQISSVETSEPVQQVLLASAKGQSRLALAEALLGSLEDEAQEADLAEALAFIDELIAAQLLVSELEPMVTGIAFWEHLHQVLARLDNHAVPDPDLQALRAVLEEVSTQLRALDAATGAANNVAAYERIVAALAVLKTPIESGKLFQTDLLPGVRPDSTLDQRQQAALLAALQVLGHLTPTTRLERLEQFKQQFAIRYEAREVPLLEALDPESGISYSAYGRHAYAPLVEDLVLPEAATVPEPTPLAGQHMLARKLREAAHDKQYSVEITLAEVQSLPSVAPNLPPSFSVMFRALADGYLLLEHAGGSSGANLLGRFAHASAAIADLVGSITATEQARNPDVVLAEICHLPASRSGNILLRPCFRAFELPYLAQSGCPPEGRLLLDDLTLRLHQGDLHLRCRRTGRLVIPRLSAAHNYSQQALPVYQLLCDLQTQNLQASLGISWAEIAPEAVFRPRLVHQQVILQPASWQLSAADLAPLLAPDAGSAALGNFRQRWQLPRYFTLVDGDHELLVDAEQPVSVARWLALVRLRASVHLKEFLFAPATCLVRDSAGQSYANQLIATLLRTTACYPATAATPAAPAAPAAPAVAVPRSFTLGSEWLYYKLYCGTKITDRLLANVLAPLTEGLLAQGLVDKWFFVRYADPDPHLRLRLHLPTLAHLGQVIQGVYGALAPYVANGSLWKIQSDTYERELARYGAQTIELAESFFYYDSRRLVAQLACTQAFTLPNVDPNHAAWLRATRSIDELLTAFAYSLPRKLALLSKLRDAFAHEFAVDKPLRLQLDARYRQHRAALWATLAPTANDGSDSLPSGPLLAEIARQVLARHIHGQLEVDLDALLSSYIHMLVNRAVSGRPRLHELLLYNFLARYYQAQLAMPLT